MNVKLSPRRRALSLFLALTMMLGLLPGFTPEAQAEETPGHWADSYLSQMVEWGFIRADQAQDPDRDLTRADFMSIVNRAYGYHVTGETPFEDVTEYDWFYDDVGIAYTAQYIKGTSPTTASPNDTLDRETAATILGRNMMLQESPGDLVDFSDAHNISNWARGTIKSSMEHYLVTGYEDGTFRPQQSMNWGEIAALLTRTIGTPLQDAGDYSLGGVFGNVTVTSPGVTLRDTVISGDLYITGGVGDGGIKLENVTVLGRIIASGTGSSEGGASILMRNVTADELLVDNLENKEVSIQADGITEIGKTTVRTSAYIEDNTPEGMGLHSIVLDGEWYGEDDEVPEGFEPPRLTLAGRVEEVTNRTPNSTVHAAKGTVAKLTVDETAVGSHVVIDRGTVVKDLILDTGVDVTGEGDITKLEVNAPGCDVEMLPDQIVIRPGITAIIAGNEMDSASADEFLLDPMILSGYPKAQDIAPTSLEAVFATNKQGRIYWAVSAMTDGSIGADDLLKPPSYGNKAVKWGTVDSPRGNEETIAKITGLTSNGEYYLSAVLEDAKGQLSPVKVISFTTPDNTVPAFNSGYPYMSTVGTGRTVGADGKYVNSQVVVMTNKDCKLYYALLPQGAAAPTENELLTNTVAGAVGYGVRDVYKNTEDIFAVHERILEEKTTYVLYLWLRDADGANKSAITSLTFTTDDETPPKFVMGPEVIDVKATSVSLRFRLDEDGTVYWVAVPAGTPYPRPEPGSSESTAPLNSDYAKLQVASGMNLSSDGKAGQVTAKELVDGTINITGLQEEKAYDFYYVAKDNAGPDRNYSLEVGKLTINTLDNTGPKFTQHFSRTSGDDDTIDPMASTDIYLDVSENIMYSGEGGGLGFLEMFQAHNLDKLAQNMEASIKLHKVDSETREESQVDIDYTKVTITSTTSGIRITIPNNAINRPGPGGGTGLENGSEYYFTIEQITDTTNNRNPLAANNPQFKVDFKHNEVASKAAGHNVPVFMVEFARIWFTDNRVPRDVPTNNGVEAPIDFFFRLRPEGTSTTSSDIAYDILLWFDSIVSYDLYYRIVDDETFEPVDNVPTANKLPSSASADSNGWMYLGNSGDVMPNSGTWSGKGVNKHFNGCGAANFPEIRSLDEDLRYEFAISLTSYKGEPNRELWNGGIKLQANVAAGQSNRLNLVGEKLTNKQEWEDRVKDNTLRSVGRWTNKQSVTVNTYEGEWGQTDTGLPVFNNPTPSIHVTGSDAANVTVNLSSNGIVHYAVSAITPESGQPAATATRKLTDKEWDDVQGHLSDVSWSSQSNREIYVRINPAEGIDPVPLNGAATMPNWMKGTDKGTTVTNTDTDDVAKDNLVISPTPMNIARTSTWTAQTGKLVAQGNVNCSGGHDEIINLEKLSPETDYFIYMVIENGSEDLSHVYIYHFTTPKANKPKIDLGRYNSGDNAGATIRTDIDSRLNYFVFTLSDAQNRIEILKAPFSTSGTYKGITTATTDAYSDMTVLDALMTHYGSADADGRPSSDNGFSIFDIFATPELKREMSNFLRGRYQSTYLDTDVDIVDNSNSELAMTGNVTKEQVLKLYNGTDFVILALAHVPNPNTTVEEEIDTYAAYAPLRKGVAEPPKISSWDAFLDMTGETAGSAPYTGQVTVTFDKPLYYKDANGNLVALTSANADRLLTIGTWTPTANSSNDPIINRIKPTVTTDAQQTTIVFESYGTNGGWKNGDRILIQGSQLFNSNGMQCESNLTVTVNSTSDGMRVTLTYGSTSEPFNFPYLVEADDIRVELNVTPPLDANVTGDPLATQTLLIDDSTTSQFSVSATLSPTKYQAMSQFQWRSSNTSVASVATGADKGTSATFTVNGIGETTIQVTVVTTLDDGQVKTNTKQLRVVVGGTIKLTDATTTNSTIDKSSISDTHFIWEVVPTQSTNPTAILTFTSTRPLVQSAITVTTSASNNNCLTRQPSFNLSNDNKTLTVTVQLTGTIPTVDRQASVTVNAGISNCTVKIDFQGSQTIAGNAIGNASENPANQ